MAELNDDWDSSFATVKEPSAAPQSVEQSGDDWDRSFSDPSKAIQYQNSMPPQAPQQVYEQRAGEMPTQEFVQGSNPDSIGPLDAMQYSVIEDPRVRMEKYAAQRFPHEPDAVERRYSIVDGDIVYRDNYGVVQKELGDAESVASDYVGKTALPIAGTILGTIFGGPGLGALWGMGGLSMNKNLGLAQGDNQDSAQNVKDLLLQGAVDYVIPKGASYVGSKIANRLAAKDIMSLDAAGSARLKALAEEFDITLTPAELTKMGSLINQQNRYAMGMDATGDTMAKFYGDRGKKIAGIMDDFFGQAKDLDVAGLSAKKVAANSIKDAQKGVSAGSRQLYNQVIPPEVKGAARQYKLVPEKAFDEINANPLINKYINKVKEDPIAGLMDAPNNSTAVIDAAGKLMREDAATAATKTGIKGQFTEGKLNDARTELLTFMEKTYPAYNAARTTQAIQRENYLNSLKDGIEGVVAATKNTSLHGIPDKLLSAKGVSAASVANWRKQFMAQGKGKEWDELVGSYLRQVWETKATKGRTVKDLSGARFHEMVFGTPGQQKILREALGPKKYKDFSNLMEVLEATGTAPGRQSMTQPAQEAAKKEMGDAAPIANWINNIDVTQPQRTITNWWTEHAMGKWRESLAKVITSRDAMRELERMRVLRKLDPSAQRKMEVAAQVLAKSVGVYTAAPSATPQEAPQ